MAMCASVDSPPMTHPKPPLAGDEIATLLGSLERTRATLAWKCGCLDAAGLRATAAASSITWVSLDESPRDRRRIATRRIGSLDSG